MLTVLAVHAALDLGQGAGGRRTILGLGGILATAYLLRMDMLLLAAAVLGFLLFAGGIRRQDANAWRAALALFLVTVGAYEIFRLAYFGDPLPNTYYLKMTGVPLEIRLLRGLDACSGFARPLTWLWVGLTVCGLGIRAYRRRPYALLALVVLVYVAYSVWVGGDVWEEAGLGANRFVCFVMPLVFVLANGLLNEAWTALDAAGRAPRLAGWSRAITAAASFLGVLAVNGLWPGGNEAVWNRFLVLDRPLHVGDHERFTRQVLAFQRAGLVAPDARVAVVWAGIPAYFSSWEMVDVLGYNDRWLAHRPSKPVFRTEDYRTYLPGHVKFDWEHTLQTYRPDLVFQVWGIPDKELVPTMPRFGYAKRRQHFWLRVDSKKVRPTGWGAALEGAS